MRPKGRGDLESLYFTYPKFEAPKDRGRLSDRTPVAIVGAGPVGMIAALTLAKYGVRSVLIERKETFNDGSRAICIARQSFYILEQLGAVDAFLKTSLGWTTGRSFFRGQQILEFKMPDGPDDKFRPMYNLEQQYIEQFLFDAVAESDLIDLRWGSEVTGLTDVPDGVELGISDTLGSYELLADWVLAADGAHSRVRTIRGKRLSGENYEGRYVIADVQMEHDYPTIRRALFDPACRPGGTVLIHKQPKNIWRIDYQLASDESAEEATQEQTVRDSVASVLAEIGHTGNWDLEWWSVYSANTLALDDYRDGRVFYVGDSAHIVPIFGVRGLNNGLADGQNIGWKLAWVLNGWAGSDLLDSYSPERRGATLDVFANASKSTRFMTPPTLGWQVMRDAALSLSLTHPAMGQLANPRQMTPYTYLDSPITLSSDDAFRAGPELGAVAADVALAEGFLTDQFGAGFTVLVFGQADLDGLDPAVKVLCLPAQGRAADVYGAQDGTVYLIRPDMHIAARWKQVSGGMVQGALRNILNRTEAAA